MVSIADIYVNHTPWRTNFQSKAFPLFGDIEFISHIPKAKG